MNPFDEIRATLKQRFRHEEKRIEAEIATHEQALDALKAQQEALPGQVFRASQKLPDNAHCPKCWILDGDLNRLTSINGGKDFDLFCCPTCRTEIEVPF